MDIKKKSFLQRIKFIMDLNKSVKLEMHLKNRPDWHFKEKSGMEM